MLVGANETGKTSLLRALDAVTAGTMQSLYGAFVLESFRDPAEPLTVAVTFDCFDDLERAVFADEINVVTDATTGETSESLCLSVTATAEEGEVFITRGWWKPGGERTCTRDHLDAVGWVLLPASRSPERELGSGRKSALRQLVGSVDLGDDQERLVEMVADLNANLNAADAVVALRTTLAADLDDLFPHPVRADDLVMRLTSASEDDPRDQADLHLRQPEGASTPLHRQSDGLRAMTTIVVQRLARTAQVLGIDEPEIHLHPRSQARIGQLLAAGSGQRIVATHSPPVLAAFPPTDAVALLPDGYRQLEVERVTEQPRLFAQWWTDNALEPLTARTVLLVEGPSDRLLVRSAATRLGTDLDHLGCAVVVAHGAAGFHPLLKLFGPRGFGLHIFGLVDAAELPIAAAALGVDPDETKLQAARFEVSHEDLEDECVRALGVPRHLELLVASGLFDRTPTVRQFGVTDSKDIDAARYLAWCRAKKLEVAAALASELEPGDVTRIESVVRIISQLQA